MFDLANAAAGVTLAADINLGAARGRDPLDDYIDADFKFAMVELQGKLYLNAQNCVSGHELWEYDPVCPQPLAASGKSY